MIFIILKQYQHVYGRIDIFLRKEVLGRAGSAAVKAGRTAPRACSAAPRAGMAALMDFTRAVGSS